MLGRALFGVVCLLIAAGLLLPMYPSEVVTAGVGAADRALLVAERVELSCANCAPAASDDRCVDGCGCAHAPPATLARPSACLSLTIYLIVRPTGPSSASHSQPPKLPTI